MSDLVVNDPDNARFVLRRGDQIIGKTDYRIDGNVITFIHTEIDSDVQERGLGTVLVQGALDQVREDTDYRVVAECPFTRAFIRHHPEYRDLTER